MPGRLTSFSALLSALAFRQFMAVHNLEIPASVPRVGFIVTKLSRPAENVVAILQQARHVRAMDQGGQARDQKDAANMPLVRCQRRPSPASCTRPICSKFGLTTVAICGIPVGKSRLRKF